ncbi:MAG: Hsp70 family protein, partial [Cytophagales bacterium]|nr:Hsp70 family protein [Armatimonadota bacterium]
MPTIIGIDLGTTNSLVAYADKGVPTVLRDPKTGDALVPSVVHFPTDGTRPMVGEVAKKYLSILPARTIYSAKRLMGRGLPDMKGETAALPYTLSPEYQETVRIDLGDGQVVSAPEVGALVLR